MAENAHCVSVVMTIAPWLDTRQAHTGTKRQSDPSVPEAPQPRSARLPVLSCQPTEAAAKPAGAVLRIPPSAGRVGAEPALAASVRHGFPLPGENRPSRSAGGRHAGLHTIVGSRHALGRATRRQFKMGKSHGPDASTTRSAPPEPRKTAPASPVASPSSDAPRMLAASASWKSRQTADDTLPDRNGDAGQSAVAGGADISRIPNSWQSVRCYLA